MDPLSIAASAVGIAAFCGKLVENVGQFVVDVKSLPESIQAFFDTITALKIAIEGIEDELSKRTHPLPFEKRHHTHIANILASCQKSLQTLERSLPQPKEKTSSFERMRLSLEKSLKDTVIQDTISRIHSYTQVLQLSMTTLTLYV